jgi:hypothetical protein
MSPLFLCCGSVLLLVIFSNINKLGGFCYAESFDIVGAGHGFGRYLFLAGNGFGSARGSF